MSEHFGPYLLNVSHAWEETRIIWPQNAELRRLRARLARSQLDQAGHDAAMARLTPEAVRWQEKVGVDVPAHGEFDRNDTVNCLGEQLADFAFGGADGAAHPALRAVAESGLRLQDPRGLVGAARQLCAAAV